MKVSYLEQFFARPLGWWSTFAALCLLLLAPLLLADLPPILDYPNHLARLFILAQAGAGPVPDGKLPPPLAGGPGPRIFALGAPPWAAESAPVGCGDIVCGSR